MIVVSHKYTITITITITNTCYTILYDYAITLNNHIA